jgi:hypothetical protein
MEKDPEPHNNTFPLSNDMVILGKPFLLLFLTRFFFILTYRAVIDASPMGDCFICDRVDIANQPIHHRATFSVGGWFWNHPGCTTILQPRYNPLVGGWCGPQWLNGHVV